MGLEFALLLSFLGALAWLIPWFGAVIAVILPFLVGAGSGHALGFLAALYTLAVLFVQEFVIEPRIFRRQSYSLVVLVLVVLALVDIFGLPGLILAPLVSAALQIFFKHLVQSPFEVASARVFNKEAGWGMEALQLRWAEKRTEMENWEDPVSPEISNLIHRLEQLITETHQYLN
jgi:predicted PurR-regulated permease PerM